MQLQLRAILHARRAFRIPCGPAFETGLRRMADMRGYRDDGRAPRLAELSLTSVGLGLGKLKSLVSQGIETGWKAFRNEKR